MPSFHQWWNQDLDCWGNSWERVELGFKSVISHFNEVSNHYTCLKHHDHGDLQKKAFNWADSFTGWESMILKWGRGLRNRWDLTSHKQGAERACWEWWKGSEASKPTPQDVLPNVSQTVCPPGHQVFRQLSLWPPFSFKHPQHSSPSSHHPNKTLSVVIL